MELLSVVIVGCGACVWQVSRLWKKDLDEKGSRETGEVPDSGALS